MKRIMVSFGIGFALLLVMGVTHKSLGNEQDFEQHFVVNSLSMPGSPEISWHNSLESGWRESRRSGRPMVIFITSDRCKYCDAMKQSTWCESSVRRRIGRGFVAIRLKPGQNDESLSRIDVPMYPTTIVGSPAGKVIAHRTGFQPPGSLHELLTDAVGGILSRRNPISQRR